MSQKYANIVPSADPTSAEQTGIQPASPKNVIKKLPGEQSSGDAEQERMGKEQAVLLHQRMFADNRDTLIESIDSTNKVVGQLREWAADHWIIHYPETDRVEGTASSSSPNVRRSHSTAPGESLEAGAPQTAAEHPTLHRSYTAAVPHTASAPTTPTRKPLNRSNTLSPSSVDEPKEGEMSVLRLDLKLGATTRNPSALVKTLEKSSIAQLLDGRMSQSQRHLNNLKARISDKQSKVLVTGDLNAGKSTFVNALLRRRVMPTDQQPCTTVFCETLDANESNEGVEEVHMLKNDTPYDRTNESTYTKHSLAEIEKIVADAEELSSEDAPLLKCYCADTRSAKASLLHNGVVDISLIDAPGLNRDSLKTTALFARQEEIDVVVFVVSAENHFTLSAKEFLWNASNDKAYVFIVVNKFDQIRNKDKCKRLVLDQIRQLSPRTYEDAEELVHFVDSSSVFGATPPVTPGEEVKVGNMDEVQGNTEASTSFAALEASLRDFVLQKRSKSKLMPAQTYVLRLLLDLAYVARTNLDIAHVEKTEAQENLNVDRPALKEGEKRHAKLESELEMQEEGIVSGVVQGSRFKLDKALQLISNGQSSEPSLVSLPEWKGLLNVLEYAQQVRTALLESMEASVKTIEDSARGVTIEAVEKIRKMGKDQLPAEAASKENQRVFLPEAMFAKRRNNSRGTAFAGLGLSEDLVEVKLTDLFDLPHYILIVSRKAGLDHLLESASDGKERSLTKQEKENAAAAGGLTLSLGAVTLLGGKTLGAKTLIDSVLKFTSLASNGTVRKWTAPVFAVVGSVLVVWYIRDLPNSIPRNAGRSIAHELQHAPIASTRPSTSGLSTTVSSHASANANAAATTKEGPTFVEFQTNRTARETRRVLRLVSWEVHEMFRVHLSEVRARVEKEENRLKSAKGAQNEFESMLQKVAGIEQRTREVDF
ncbi:hypothetical protein IE81DRAFT_304554 [Ceraceosorus guamensis]|uniref:Dynamin-type G domain-containing protein n=1 Tax=Ceraceosorus guamensis TaxID=1522189 RepID=A0A316VTX7_9BASI|nr:hypothetical protein IE81DRAFT_304554 [Ceraceosorus guamensis]PWN40860.1 hypothetical protein IE81DRAFT_304554 [Ceraceosorus guamensis]